MLTQLKHRFCKTLQTCYPEEEITALFFLSMQKITGDTRSALLANPALSLTAEQEERLTTVLTRLQRMEPIQYIFEECEFYGLTFGVNPAVLIPRPETEELVEWIVSDCVGTSGKLLDIGTGSGCIAVATARFLESFQVSAIDISRDALTVAQKNAQKNGSHIHWIEGDILQPGNLEFIDTFDVIASNPPYICESKKRQMARNVLEYEPSTALFVPDNDPLIFYKAIASFGKKHLNKTGWLYLEINETLGQETVDLLISSGYEKVELRKDISGKNRMIRAKMNDKD